MDTMRVKIKYKLFQVFVNIILHNAITNDILFTTISIIDNLIIFIQNAQANSLN